VIIIEYISGFYAPVPKKKRHIVKGIVSKLTIKFRVCQKCGRLKDDNLKIATSSAE
jgi:hypothetical protein